MNEEEAYDVVVVGGGASGTALLYTLAKYTNIERIAILEKADTFGSLNSHATNNSQTLHVGDIETNYTVDKVRDVYPSAMMVKRYADSLSEEKRAKIIRPVHKMVLGVGESEVQALDERYAALKDIFPTLERLDGEGIAKIEPEIMRGRRSDEPVAALFNSEGYAVNFGLLAQSFVSEAIKIAGERMTICLSTRLLEIEPFEKGYRLVTSTGAIRANIVIVDTDAYSLGFAKSLGLGKEFSLIPVAGTFFFSPQKLNGKVYRVQEKRMPFAAVHGDPDLTKDGLTRWGPTARFYPVLEANNAKTVLDFFRVSGLHRFQTWISFFFILLEPIRFWYLLKNFFYDIPIIGKHLLLPQLRKIVPTLTAKELQFAKGYGGMRLQRVDTNSRQLLLGEGKIVGERIIFNMTPSPGASVSLYNAMRDAAQIMAFEPRYEFDKQRMLTELCINRMPPTGRDPSLEDSYAS